VSRKRPSTSSKPKSKARAAGRGRQGKVVKRKTAGEKEFRSNGDQKHFSSIAPPAQPEEVGLPFQKKKKGDGQGMCETWLRPQKRRRLGAPVPPPWLALDPRSCQSHPKRPKKTKRAHFKTALGNSSLVVEAQSKILSSFTHYPRRNEKRVNAPRQAPHHGTTGKKSEPSSHSASYKSAAGRKLRPLPQHRKLDCKTIVLDGPRTLLAVFGSRPSAVGTARAGLSLRSWLNRSSNYLERPRDTPSCESRAPEKVKSAKMARRC